MGASNKQGGNANYYKLKEVKDATNEANGQYRFIKQEKKGDKWGDGEMFNNMSGTIVDVQVREFEYEGKPKKSLEITFDEVGEKSVVTLGLASSAANSILNTLAGENGFDLEFSCGKPRKSDKDGKYYPSLYINNLNGSNNEERKTKWYYEFDKLPKVTVTKDEEGNEIKKGVKAAQEFWLKVVSDVQSQMGGKSEGNKKPYNNPNMEVSASEMIEGNDVLDF